LPGYGIGEDDVFNDLVFINVPWLSHKRILQGFPVLGIPIQGFLKMKGMPAI